MNRDAMLAAAAVLLDRWLLATAEGADPERGDPTVDRVIIETMALRKLLDEAGLTGDSTSYRDILEVIWGAAS